MDVYPQFQPDEVYLAKHDPRLAMADRAAQAQGAVSREGFSSRGPPQPDARRSSTGFHVLR